MTESLVFEGTWTALVTPFTEAGEAVDFESLARLVAYQLAGGVDGLVICGSTGEAATLSDEEYRLTVQRVLESVAGRVPCIVGVNSNNTLRAAQVSRAVVEWGAQGVLVVTPPYNKPTQDGLQEHFRRVKDACGAPLVAYNVPGRTGVNMLPATVGALARQGVIDALKESSGSIDQMLDILAITRKPFSLLCGDDSLGVSAVLNGARGLVSVVSNGAPRKCASMIRCALAGEVEQAREVQFELLPLMRALFMETNPIPVKCLLSAMGLIRHATVRLPLMASQPGTEARIRSLVSSGGIE